ncbi:hypothetical protein [Bacillus sp. OV166]|uniref:hypothetical protein n=1 Tax=Bacillus sp. OV166 TaxID=1882763 RepID=UPI0015C4F6D5|nr:hypothetical protein [Bacillus sp. OV166]
MIGTQVIINPAGISGFIRLAGSRFHLSATGKFSLSAKPIKQFPLGSISYL